jgi:ABC-type phosphate/phosphonate transport system substrate-binding protein
VIASLAMYPFDIARPAFDTIWAAARNSLDDAPDTLRWDDPRPHWTSPELYVGQACGWPLVTELSDRVAVVGCFDLDLDGAFDGTYRSALIAHPDNDRWRTGVAAVNDRTSLSGWISLHAALSTVDRWFVTGSHVASCEAVADGRADVASIDALSLHLFMRERPELATQLRIVGSGPAVPCLPLITAHRHLVGPLRQAFRTACTDPQTAEARHSLALRGFMERDLGDYLHLVDLSTGS